MIGISNKRVKLSDIEAAIIALNCQFGRVIYRTTQGTQSYHLESNDNQKGLYLPIATFDSKRAIYNALLFAIATIDKIEARRALYNKGARYDK